MIKKTSFNSFTRHTQWAPEAYHVIDLIGDRLIERLSVIKHRPKWILDLGSGDATFSRKLGRL